MHLLDANPIEMFHIAAVVLHYKTIAPINFPACEHRTADKLFVSFPALSVGAQISGC